MNNNEPASGSGTSVRSETNMSLNALRYIVAVDTHRSFVRAAGACGVTQPTLSAGIRSLESALDVNIFDRRAHPVKPTVLGEKIIAQARLTLRNASQIQEIVAVEKGDGSGKVSMGIIPTIAPYILPGLFREIRTSHPDIRLTVSEMRTPFIIGKLLSAETDMAIMASPLEQEGLLEIPLYYEKFVAYISPSDELYRLDEIPSDRLVSDRLWILEEGHCLRSQVFSFCHSRQHTRTGYQAGSIDTLVRIVDTNGGYTVIPELHTDFLTAAQRANLRPIVRHQDTSGKDCPTCIPVREVSLVIREDYVRERLLNVIAGCIRNIVPQEMLDSRLRRFAIKL